MRAAGQADTAPATAALRTNRLIIISLAAALLGAAWLVDPFVGFDPPKRFAVLMGAALGAAALAWRLQPSTFHTICELRNARGVARLAWLSLAAALLAFAGLLLSTVLADQPAAGWDSLRSEVLLQLLLPLGASAALDGVNGRRLFGIAVIAIALNAVVSLFQHLGLQLPLEVHRLGGRYPTGALLGNEAYVALACSLMGAAGLALGLGGTAPRWRWTGWALLALAVAAIIVNRQLTSAAALGAAAFALLALRFRAPRWLLPAVASLALLLPLCAAVPALRTQTWARLPYPVESYQRLTTYRLGAWAAAVQMAATRPWTGYGPGSYASQSQVQRFAAEIALRQRLSPPPPATNFVQAHQEYLQLAAEAGLPVLLATLAALGLLLAGLLQLARRAAALQAQMLLGVLIAGAVAALAWFPLQIPLTAVVLLLACGRAWRLLATAPEEAA